MSKGNVVLGYGRGAVGDIVLTRLKGQQVAKARNRQPANPRTALQMRQRAGFVAPLKFYTRGVQNLFQFAFTDKRLKESDYNAFMRINVGDGFPLTPDEFHHKGFPALGSWTMSRGSMSGIQPVVVEEHSNSIGFDCTPYEATSTIGALSSYMMSSDGVEVGDIITFVCIRAYGTKVTATTIDVDEGAEVRWVINQFKVDPNDTREIQDVMPGMEYYDVDGNKYIGINAAAADINEAATAMAIIRSRITTKGLRVSTSRLVCGGYVDDYVAFRNTPAEIARVLAEWGASSTAILKGGLL